MNRPLPAPTHRLTPRLKATTSDHSRPRCTILEDAMASPKILDAESDYGSDFSLDDELLLIEINSKHSQGVAKPASIPPPVPHCESSNIDSVPGLADIVDGKNAAITCDSTAVQTVRIVESSCKISPVAAPDITNPVPFETDIKYPDLSRALARTEVIRDGHAEALGDKDTDSEEFGDDRSPLQRFRSYPKRPLTVTDLTAGAWCELQYWYTLTRLPGGRRTKTPAMKGGSRIHKKLEDEVHTSIHVDVLTKEDAFALRMWNFIQGLRTLRETGLTRELEVWGVVHGNFVNGVIDALTHKNPNPEFETELMKQSKPECKQTSLSSYFTRNGKHVGKVPSAKVYVIDVKTRGSLAPVTTALLRPAKIQLLLYHRFLSDIAAGRLDFLKLFRRYGLDPDDTFSDGFIAQIGGFHDEIFEDALSPEAFAVGIDADESSQNLGSQHDPGYLKYQTLRDLLSLVQDEIKLTFPEGDMSMGQMLQVQYVHRDDGRELDVHDFPVADQALNGYLEDYMSWWNGKRKACGVDIEEAFKCRTCEFTADCSWRIAMAEEQMQKARVGQQARRQANGLPMQEQARKA